LEAFSLLKNAQSPVSADMEAMVPVGQPGLSFRYVKTFGETEVAYLVNTTHLNFPYSVSAIGNSIWVGELWGNRVLKYTSGGAFQKTYGTPGFPDADDNTYFWEAADLEEDSAGYIWVVDTANQFISKIDNSGTRVFSLGTRWEQGDDNDHFMFPIGIAFDAAGNVYVSDGAPWWDEGNGNHRIQIFQGDGTYLATIGETGVCDGDNAHLCGPAHIAVDGNLLYVADRANDRVQVFNISNPSTPAYVTTLANDFDGPSGVAVDGNYIYVADSYNNRVQIFNKATYAYVNTIGGNWGTGAYEFKSPTDVAVDASGRLYVADFVNQRVQQYTRAGAVWTYSRTYGVTGIPYLTDPYHYNRPTGVGIAADGSMYIVEENGHRLTKFNAAGDTLLWSVGVPGLKGDWTSNPNIFSNPADLAFDSSGKVYVADRWHGQVRVYNPSNGSHHASIDIFGCPGGITISSTDFLYVADPCDQTVKIYNPAYQQVAVMGVSGETGSDNNHFRDLEDVAVGSDGKIYVADAGNARVQVFNADRTYLRTLGETGVFGRDFGHFGWVNGLALDSAQRLYIADEWENRIQVYDQDGAYLTTIGGEWGGRNGQMRGPSGVALDSAGNAYVADTYNHRIQKFTLGTPGWEQVNINGFGAIDNTRVSSLITFQGQLYAGVGNDNGAQLWHSSDGTAWSAVTTNGFGNVRNVNILSLFEFNGNLYAGTYNWDTTNNQSADGAQLWRSANGTTWAQVTMTGFDAANNSSIIELTSYNGKLYASTWNDGLQGGNLWVSDSGDNGTWSLVTAGFGDTHNAAIIVMESFGANLYAGTFNGDSGGEVWRSATGDDDSWNQVNTGGFGNSENIGISSLTTFDSYLYASSSSWSGAGQKVWRCQVCDGNDWVQVLNIPDDGASNLYVQGEKFYAATGNMAGGMNVWVTTNGTTWTKIASDGFGNQGNAQPSLFNSMTVFANRLYIGTENWANGGQIWRTVTATISGNAGIGGATLSYGDGGPQTVTADGSGNYTITVLSGWSGTVTPSKAGYVFTPASRTYSNVTSDQLNQDYWVTFPAAWSGGLVLTSDQPVVAVGRPHVGAEVMTYNGFGSGSTTMYVPMLFKNAFSGNYNAALYVQNISDTTSANVSISYYDSSGALTCSVTNESLSPLASKGYWMPSVSCLPVGWVGGAVVTSDEPIVAVGRPHIGSQVTTYAGFASGSPNMYVPMLFKNAFAGGSYNAALYIQNTDPALAAMVDIDFYDSDGSLTCSLTGESIAALATKGYWMPSVACLPVGWVGGAVISADRDVVAVGRPHIGAQVTTYNGFSGGQAGLRVPMLFKNAFAGGSYNAALYIQNTDASQAATVDIDFYDSNGSLTCSLTGESIAARATKGYWMPSVACLPTGWVGGAVITANRNVVAVGRPHVGAEVATYGGFGSGSTEMYLPMLFKDAFGGSYDSAVYVQNTSGGSPANVTFKFYDTVGNLSCLKAASIPAGATVGYWLPSLTCTP
jgi:hypothetical protein